VADSLKRNLNWDTVFIGEKKCFALLGGRNRQESVSSVDTVGDPEFGIFKGISEVFLALNSHLRCIEVSSGQC
jgi:hypothetical protein